MGSSSWAPPGGHLAILSQPSGWGSKGQSRCEALNSRGSGTDRSPWQQDGRSKNPADTKSVCPRCVAVCPASLDSTSSSALGALTKETTSVLKESHSLRIQQSICWYVLFSSFVIIFMSFSVRESPQIYFHVSECGWISMSINLKSENYVPTSVQKISSGVFGASLVWGLKSCLQVFLKSGRRQDLYCTSLNENTFLTALKTRGIDTLKEVFLKKSKANEIGLLEEITTKQNKKGITAPRGLVWGCSQFRGSGYEDHEGG